MYIHTTHTQVIYSIYIYRENIFMYVCLFVEVWLRVWRLIAFGFRHPGPGRVYPESGGFTGLGFRV